MFIFVIKLIFFCFCNFVIVIMLYVICNNVTVYMYFVSEKAGFHFNVWKPCNFIFSRDKHYLIKIILISILFIIINDLYFYTYIVTSKSPNSSKLWSTQRWSGKSQKPINSHKILSDTCILLKNKNDNVLKPNMLIFWLKWTGHWFYVITCIFF